MQASILSPELASAEMKVAATDLLPDSSPAEPGLIAEWQELFARSHDAGYLQNPDHVQLVSRLNSATELLTPRLLTCRSEHQLIAAGALIPKRISCGPRMDMFTRRSLSGFRLAGSRFLEVQDESPQVLDAFIQEVKNTLTAPKVDFVLFEDVQHDSAMWHALHGLSREGYLLHFPQGVQPRLRIRFPEVPEDYWKQFSSKTRNTFRRKQKHLGETKLLKFTRPDEVSEFLRLSHQVSQNSWQSRQLGLRITNSADERTLLEWEANAGVLRAYVLMQEDRPLAFLLGNQYHGWFNYEEVGYDQEFSSRSPGTVLLLQVFEEMFANDPPEVFDFGTGDADYKRMLANWTSQSGAIWLVSRKFSSQAMVRGLQTARAIRQFGRSMLAKAGMWRKVRQFLRRGSVSTEAKGA